MNYEKKTRFEAFSELNEIINELGRKCGAFRNEQEVIYLYLSHIAGSLAILADHAPLILACLQKKED